MAANIIKTGVLALLISCITGMGCGDKKTDTTDVNKNNTQQQTQQQTQQNTQKTDTMTNKQDTTKKDSKTNTKESNNVVIKTSMGDIEVELFEKDAPQHVANFKKLVNSKFYNGTTFHRVIKGFMIQAGDPNSKDADK